LIGVGAPVVEAQPDDPVRASSVLTSPFEHPSSPQSDVLVHIVERSETVFSIAEQYGLSPEAIIQANGIRNPRKIYLGQRLVILNPRKLRTTSTVPYVVQAGDTLSTIARQRRTTWRELAALNGLLSPSTLYVGQVIQVPELPASQSSDQAADVSSAERGAVRIVRPGDTVFGLALRYDLSRWTVAAVNGVANPTLVYPGQELFLPGVAGGRLPEPFATIDVHPIPLRQGQVVLVAVRTSEPVSLRGQLSDIDLPFYEEDGVYYGLAAIHVFADPGLYDLELTAVDTDGHSTFASSDVLIRPGSFGYERIALPPDRVSLLDPAVIAAERERLDAATSIETPQRHWSGSFERPTVGAISSYFGSRRAYSNGPYTSFHSGIDFRGPTGTDVWASAPGVVVFVDSLAIHGNTIIVDHGWGVLTGYCHLSAMEVTVGQHVVQGEKIGEVGNTGQSTGAHLHWEVWVGGVSVDGLDWIDGAYALPGPAYLSIGG
jgi:murein DD-endopeptidase MepM/ murein hydrolase activator NlpD